MASNHAVRSARPTSSGTMQEAAPRQGSLVLYKNQPAIVERVGEKLDIALERGKTQKVRPKDIVLLHLGPVGSLGELAPQTGEVEAAREILEGQTTTLAELAELAYGSCTPATAWAAWQLLSDGVYFEGTPERVVPRTAEQVARTQAVRVARTTERVAASEFMARLRAGRTAPEDAPRLKPVVDLALGRAERSGVLDELGRGETPENAHALLLELGVWSHTDVPYPERLRLPTAAPEVDLPDLPDEERVDLTHLPAFAIDDEGSRDPDDALSFEAGRLWVHVADAAALAPADSPADMEARARGANLYLPDGIVNMLPAKATALLGLGLADVSPALSFGLDVSPEGEIVGKEVVPSWVRVQRLTYEQAEARLDEEPFASLQQLAQAREGRRLQNGAVAIELPGVSIHVEDGRVSIRPLPPLKSRSLVSEAMLVAGEAAARFAIERDIPFAFATQVPPEAGERLEGLAGMFALRRTLKRSQQKSVPGPHAGLGLPVYAQATSPLRRYLDLVAHQQLRAHLRGEAHLDAQELLERVGAADAVTGSVRQAERLARQHWTLVYLMQNPDWHGEGVLVEKRGPRGKVLIPELSFEAQVHLREDLPLNSRMALAVSGVVLPELRANFRVVG